MASIKMSELADAIAKELESYSQNVDDIMQDEIKITSKEVLKEVKKAGGYDDKSGNYRKSISLKKVVQGQGFLKNVIYAKAPYYRLTHLLEYGHAKSTGGRTKAYPHWAEGQKIVETLDERMKRRLVK